jgi:hypothetical protein
MQKQVNVQELSIEELKVVGFDLINLLEKVKNDLIIIQTELNKRFSILQPQNGDNKIINNNRSE